MLLRNSQLRWGMLVRNSSGRGPMVVRNDNAATKRRDVLLCHSRTLRQTTKAPAARRNGPSLFFSTSSERQTPPYPNLDSLSDLFQPLSFSSHSPPQIWPRPPLPPPTLHPDHQDENRPRYPGGWGSGVGSHRRCAITLSVTWRRGGQGQAFQALARSCLPSCLPSRLPRSVPSLTYAPEGMREGTREGRHLHVDACFRRHLPAHTQCGVVRSELARSPAGQLVAHGRDHPLALGTWRKTTELLGVRLHRLACGRMEIDLSSHRTRDAVERVDRRVGVRAFKLC